MEEGEDISSLLAGGDDTVKEESTEKATKIHNKKPRRSTYKIFSTQKELL
jgi:hypothetical protein